MADHFLEQYGKKARYFVYNSKQLHNLESFSSDAGINVMIINVQAFNARGEDARRIYVELDDFQSRQPDRCHQEEPSHPDPGRATEDGGQGHDGEAEGVRPADDPALLRHAQDGAQQGLSARCHRRLQPEAREEDRRARHHGEGLGRDECLSLSGRHQDRDDQAAGGASGAGDPAGQRDQAGAPLTQERTTTLYDLSDGLEQYRGFVVSDINAIENTISFTNGVVLGAGEATGDVNESSLRRIQIREAIKAHFEKEQALFAQGIKVLSLFFIDEVAKYRSYDETGEVAGEYARMFEEEYDAQLNEVLTLEDTPYNHYLEGHQSREDAQRLLLDRQEDEATGRSRREEARRRRRGSGRRGCL